MKKQVIHTSILRPLLMLRKISRLVTSKKIKTEEKI